MKMTFIFAMMCIFTLCLAGCGSQTADPGTPPEEVLHPDTPRQKGSEASSEQIPEQTVGTSEAPAGESSGLMASHAGSGELMENVVSIRIGRDGRTEYGINMYDNAAVNTMLGYLSSDGLLFPAYTYDEDEGYVAQNIRGSYSRDDEVEVSDIRAGELYLFSGGQLRLYFKDVSGANITATPVGVFADTSSVGDAVTSAYEANKGDTWGVDVYFWITKTKE